MATDSSPGEKIDLSFTHPVPKPAGASPEKPAAKREATNGGAANGASGSAKTTPGKPVTAKRIKPTEPSSPVVEETVAQRGDDEDTAEDAPKQTGRASKAAVKPSKSKSADQASRGKKGRRSSAREELEELEKVGALSLMTLVPAWLISALVHMVILVIFGLMLMPAAQKEPEKNLMAMATDKLEPLDDVAELQPEAPDIDTQVDVAVDLPPTPVATEDVMPTEIMDAEPPPTDAPTFAQLELPATSATSLLSATSSSISGKGVSGRGAKVRADLAKLNGATGESEVAVARALKWLAEHQYADGSWSFDHTGGNCGGKCGNPGALADARLAATGMALLPFLGAGNTHKQGKYKETVHAGLYYLITHANLIPKQGADFTGGGGAMYGQGIASIALCEAYAMSNDRELQQPAQLALNYIQYSQDPVGGGWNYTPRGAGDTSIAGWQIMALKSGMLNFLEVKEETTKRAGKFLDSVQAEGGAYYGYRSPAQGPATTAVGLLCRMYLGWKKDNPALEKGVRWLAAQGPTTANMYFSYYATQVVFQFDGKDGSMWREWNAKMRDALVTSQSTKGHEEGSWMFPGGDHGFTSGGRLYCTAMATMTLEVYYRYMPIYQEKNVDKDWEF